MSSFECVYSVECVLYVAMCAVYCYVLLFNVNRCRYCAEAWDVFGTSLHVRDVKC